METGNTTILRSNPKKARKPQERSLYLRDAILRVAARYETLTVRQLYYQLVAERVIDKTEQTYKRVCDQTAQLRLSGELPFAKIADGHRTRRTTMTHHGVADALQDMHGYYRRDYWRTQPRQVEVWCEKDALSGIIQPICMEYGVPYVATRGYPSLTLLYESAMALKANQKPAVVFYFGDHDPSGQNMSDRLQGELHRWYRHVKVGRVALNPEQIEQYSLPTRPGKDSDTRNANFVRQYGNESVELDALSPDVLAERVRTPIKNCMDMDEWKRMEAVEAAERETLQRISLFDWSLQVDTSAEAPALPPLTDKERFAALYAEAYEAGCKDAIAAYQKAIEKEEQLAEIYEQLFAASRHRGLDDEDSSD